MMRAMTQRHVWQESILLAALPLLAFGISVRFGFVDWDDPLLLIHNPWVDGLSWANLRYAFLSYDPELYVPLTTLSYQLNFAIAGLAPWIYHATNLALHITNVLLVYAIAKRFFDPRSALLSALLFSVHPLHTEAVVWAAARKDLLSGAFALGSLLQWLRWTEQRSKTRYAGSLALFLCALASKVSILGLPLLLPFLTAGHTPQWSKARARAALPFLGLSCIFAVIALFGKETAGHFYEEQMLIGAVALARLLGSLLLPLWLTPLYPFTAPITLREPMILGSVALILALTAAAFAARRRSRWPLFAWAWFALFIAPSFGNFAKGHDELLDVYVTSDRYAYLASLGPLLCVGWLFGRGNALWQKGAAALITVMVLLSVRQTLTWRDNESLWLQALRVSPNSHIAHTNLGTILVKRGDLEGGRRQYAASLAIRPSALAYYNLGQLLEHDGQRDHALAAYRKAVEQSPLDMDSWLRIAALLLQQGNVADARLALQSAKEADPANTAVDTFMREFGLK